MLYTYMCMAAVCRLATGMLSGYNINKDIIQVITEVGTNVYQCTNNYDQIAWGILVLVVAIEKKKFVTYSVRNYVVINCKNN